MKRYPTRGGIFRPLRPILAVLALASCAWDQAMVPLSQPQIATKPDPAAALVLQCDKLGFSRYSDSHRLCVLRGIDRLAVAQGTTTGYAPIQVLPYAYPPLVPGNSVLIAPTR